MTPQEFFKKDLFAEQTGVELLEVREGYSKARLVITENHLNAGHRTQGGAIFTLADLALAAAANSHGTLAFSLSSNITFLRASGRHAVCRSTRTVHRTYYRILPDRYHESRRKIDCYIRVQRIQKRGSAAVQLITISFLLYYRRHRITISLYALQESLCRPEVKIHIQTNREMILII